MLIKYRFIQSSEDSVRNGRRSSVNWFIVSENENQKGDKGEREGHNENQQGGAVVSSVVVLEIS